jgi:hypothetical protein
MIVAAAVLAGCQAAAAPASPAPARHTAAAACTDALGDGWHVSVETDRDDSSALALVSGDSIATCQTWPNAARTDFGNTVTGIGLHPTRAPQDVSYLTRSRTGDLAPFLVGRVPPSGIAVRVTVADGSLHDAVVGEGLWLAWLDDAAEPTVIEALDGSGRVISRLADADGLQPAG